MLDPDLIALFAEPLERAGIRYMITGSVASSIYGEPRTTLDIAFMVLLTSADAKTLQNHYPEADFYLPPSEVIAIESRRESHGHFNIIHHHSGLKADIYLSRNHPYLEWALAGVRKMEIDSATVHLAPPEYVILHKLDFYRESGHQRHLRDIAGMIEQSDIELDFLMPAIAKLRLETEWQNVLDYASR